MQIQEYVYAHFYIYIYIQSMLAPESTAQELAELHEAETQMELELGALEDEPNPEEEAGRVLTVGYSGLRSCCCTLLTLFMAVSILRTVFS